MKFATIARRAGWFAGVVAAALPISLLGVSTAAAQESEEDEAGDVIEEIVVTGSRIKRATTYNSTVPLAVIDASQAVQFGSLDAASILRTSTSVTGQQIDSSLNGFVVDGGPGAETIGLRGLGPERTLVLIDGRRIGAAGTFGGAVFPDLSLIPGFLVNRAEILLSGASSIYGADAVAGVVNIITPSDFEGIKFDGFLTNPAESGGEERVASLQFGSSSDRARFFIGGEFFERDGIRARDRSWTEGGNRTITFENGQFVTDPDGFFDQTIAFGPDCTFAGYTPGEQGGGSTVPNFSCPPAIDFEDAPWDEAFGFQDQHIWSPSTRWSAFASLEYDFDVLGGTTAFVQVLNSNRTQRTNGGDAQFFPLVPADNQFNPFGAAVVPVAYDQDSRSDEDDTDVTYNRYLIGLRGDMSIMEEIGFANWTWETSLGYTRSDGTNRFDIVRQDRLVNSLNNCQDPGTPTFSGASPTCVPVNLFSDAFLTQGDFGAARDYLVTRVTNNTRVEQTAFEAGITGDTIELPAGPVGLFLGASYREDSILSNVDSNIEDANAWGRSAEGDTKGTTDIREIYTEVDIPVFTGVPYAENVGLNLSYRISDDKFFGSEDTWRITANWDFTDWVRLRGTRGTSFRAPNLKELFIADQTGFDNAFIDPCIPPPGDDERSQNVIDNCQAEGVDPFTLGADGAPSVTTVSGGADDLRPETSDSWSIGAVFTQPWFDAFDFQVSIDYTNLEIKDAVAEPSAGFILNQCYTSPNFSDPLCDRVTRDVDAAPDQRFLELVDESVANIEIENYEDLSFSTLFVTDFAFRGQAFDFTWNADFTKALEYETGLFVETADKLVDTIGVPEWQVQSSMRLGFGDWSVSHRYFFRTGGTDSEQQREDAATQPGEVDWINDFGTHDFSIQYSADTWSVFLTLENAFDEEPQIIHSDAFTGNTINNMPVGVYRPNMLRGRSILLSVSTSL